jgi:MarR family transcriptional regulator for hemolysin
VAPPNDAVPIAQLKTKPGDTVTRVRPPPAELQPHIGALLHDVARLFKRRFERDARQTGLPVTRLQARAVLYIARNEGESQAAVAAMLDIEPIALVRMLDHLQEAGLVERHLHPTDRRVRTLWLTQAGWAIVDRILKINKEIREAALDGLSPAVREMLLEALGQMKSNLAATVEVASTITEITARAGTRAAE